jgi:hypothetical protein
MSRWSSLSLRLVAAAALLAVLSLPRPARAAPGDPLLDYGVDLASNYVFRGIEVFAVQNPDMKSFKVLPAVQPYATFHGPAGLSFGLWGSYATSNRKEATLGELRTLDEMDYTLAWDWSNKLGAFSTGLVAYTLTSSAATAGTFNEVYFKWSPKIMESLSPTIAHYVTVNDTDTLFQAPTYTSLSVGGGETLSWSASLGAQTHGLQDLTIGIGYDMGPVKVSLNVAYRPNEATVIATPTGTYTKTIAWITLSTSSSVTE